MLRLIVAHVGWRHRAPERRGALDRHPLRRGPRQWPGAPWLAARSGVAVAHVDLQRASKLRSARRPAARSGVVVAHGTVARSGVVGGTGSFATLRTRRDARGRW